MFYVQIGWPNWSNYLFFTKYMRDIAISTVKFAFLWENHLLSPNFALKHILTISLITFDLQGRIQESP